MTLQTFKTRVRENRGRLSHMDNFLDKIYNECIYEFIDMTIQRKILGIESMSEIGNLTHEEQYKLYDYMASKHFKLDKKDIQLKISSILIRGM